MFKNALRICNGVEFDIGLTQDNQVIIFHDNTFERIGNNKSHVNDLTFMQINNLSFFQVNPDYLPPLFSNFIKNLSKNYQMINFEIKEEINRKYTKNEFDIIFKEIETLTQYTTAEIIVSSFDSDILNEILDRLKTPIKKGYLFKKKHEFVESYARNFDYIHPSIPRALDEEIIFKLKQLKKPLNIWTFQNNNQVSEINKIYGNQVYGYISDNSELIW